MDTISPSADIIRVPRLRQEVEHVVVRQEIKPQGHHSFLLEEVLELLLDHVVDIKTPNIGKNHFRFFVKFAFTKVFPLTNPRILDINTEFVHNIKQRSYLI
jgi:hypothetical protein